MHHHCEIIMPTTKSIGKQIKEIMEPFYEGKKKEDLTGCEFWDFYVIGGRWAGTKEVCRYDEDKVSEFFKSLKDKKITVFGLRFGKQVISPIDQIPTVDKLWNEFFPTENGEIVPCPFFDHSNDQYDSDDLLGCDICFVDEIPENLKPSRVIIAGPSWDNKKMEVTFMICENQWNGVNHMPINWDGKVKTALEMFEKHYKSYKEEYKAKIIPKPNWLCITIDYHS